MERKTIQVSATQLTFLFGAAVAVSGLIIYLIISISHNGLPKFGSLTSNPRSMPINTIDYKSTYQYINSRVAIQGYVIIMNDNKNICGTSGWSSCKTWFSYDPYQGLGPLTTKIPIGSSASSITEAGALYDVNGARMNLTHTDQFSWYRAQVVGVVEQCQGTNCTIDVDTVYALPDN